MILITVFSVILFMTQQNLDALNRQISLHNDKKVLDAYTRRWLLASKADSIKIFVNSSAEASGLNSSSGIILKFRDSGNTTQRIGANSASLEWTKIDSVIHPIEGSVSNLQFSTTNGSKQPLLGLALNLANGTDTSYYVRSVYPRN